MTTILEGQRFGLLTIFKKVRIDNKDFLECSCDCGKLITKTLYSFKLKSATFSCGCTKNARPNLWNYSKLDPKEASFIRLYKTQKSKARQNGREFSLNLEEFKTLITSSCHYCEIPPNKQYNSNYRGGKYRSFNKERINAGFINIGGIDRKDNSRGYTLENSLPCCFVCNRAKNNLSYEEFIKKLRQISQAWCEVCHEN